VSSKHLSFQFRIRRFTSTENFNFPFLDVKISGRSVGIEFIAAGDDPPIEIPEELFAVTSNVPGRESIAARPVPCPSHTPIEVTHHTVVVHRRKSAFPVIHPLHVA